MREISITATVPDTAGQLLKSDYDLWLFWSKVEVAGEDDCWLWTGTKINTGYGQHRVGKQKVLSHRIAYRDAVGPIPDGKVLQHGCHNRPCCNPKHLTPGTQHENIAEAFALGRMKAPDPSAGGRASQAARRARAAASP